MSKKLNRREVLLGAAAVVAAAALPQKAEAESVSNWWDEAETEGFRKAWQRPPIPLTDSWRYIDAEDAAWCDPREQAKWAALTAES